MASLADAFWQAEPRRSGQRDKVVVEGEAVKYLLWGNEIARWERCSDTLFIDDCGWPTCLTKDRLNGVIGLLNFAIASKRDIWYLYDQLRGESYVWEGFHTISVKSRKVTPCTLKRKNGKISIALSRYYDRARRLVKARKHLIVVTLDGATSYVFANLTYWDVRRVLCLRVSDDGLRAYRGRVTPSKVYSAFVKNDGARVVKDVLEHGWETEDMRSVLHDLKEFGVDIDALPKSVISQMALTVLFKS